MPQEALGRAREELKRVEHLIYVSLKYTRTVDIIKSIIERLMNAFDALFDVLLRKAKEEKKLASVPTLPRLKIDALRTVYASDQTILNYVEFFLLLKRIDKARFERTQEYRRHVTMTAHLEDSSIEITIDIIQDYYNRTREFTTYVTRLLQNENE